jgi:endonuclease YncB( thermonuclease family)
VSLAPARRAACRALGALISFAALAAAGAAESSCAIATAVLDGDSLVVRTDDGVTLQVRLAGIDAPERGQPYADDARAHLAAHVMQRELRVLPHKRDRYGRTVAEVLAGGRLGTAPAAGTPACDPPHATRDVGLAQVAAGLAWHFRRYAAEQPAARREAYAAAERHARAAHAGLWHDDDPMPPWGWRALARRAPGR